MKQIFTKKISVLKLSMLTGLIAGCLLTSISYGQTFYSKFDNPTGHYSKTEPTDCSAPAIQNIVGLADNNDKIYASISDSGIGAKYNCSGKYLLDVDLNMPDTLNAAQPGAQAGFRIKIKPGIDKDSLGLYLTVSTYLRDSLDPNTITFQEYATGGGSSGIPFKGINIDDGTGSNWFVYFTSTKPFNLLEMAVDPKIIQVDEDFEFDVFYAFGGAIEQVFPAEIANFRATVSGKNVNLSWQSLTETNVNNYRIERSIGNGVYTSIAIIPAKGNSNAAVSYAYTDKAVIDGNYLYRVVVVDNDGKSKSTNSLVARISSQGTILLYPSPVKAGQNVTVKTSETGLVNVYVFDVQGRMIKQQRTTSTGQFYVSTSGLSNGIYNVKVVSASGAVLQSKIVVN